MNQHQSQMIQNYLEIFWRRKWWFVVPFILGAIITVAYTYSLPPLYRSSTLILVEPQKVPENYVRPTITDTIQEQLNTIKPQIMSRTNLERIITQFAPYKTEEPNYLLEMVLRKIQEWTNLDLKQTLIYYGLYKERGPISIEAAVSRMAANIEVRVIGGKNASAFTVAYTHTNPAIAMQITNALASLFIEENLKFREERAEGTSQFLEIQLEEAKKALEKQEQELKQFKETYMGALPQQTEANLRTLDRLQSQRLSLEEALRKAQERRLFYETELADYERQFAEELVNPESPVVRLKDLRQQLVKLQAVFQDTYPDIVILKNQIKELEAQLAEEATSSNAGGQKLSREAQRIHQQINRVKNQLRQTDSDIASLTRRLEVTNAQIQNYEKRVEQGPENEQKLTSLLRDYSISKKNYESLLAKKLDAALAESLERRQKGEQFRILDPANLPRQPYKPERLRMLLLGIVLSGGLGAGLIFLMELLDAPLRKPEDIQETSNLPVLVTIPRDEMSPKRDRYLAAIDEPDSLMTDQYRILYTRINELSREKGYKIFAISSSIPEEGKTVTVLNLAIVMARDFGKKVLLIEGDLRSPVIGYYLKASAENEFGQGNGGKSKRERYSWVVEHLSGKMEQNCLSNVLLHGTDPHTALVPFAHENLFVLPTLKSIPNSASLVSSPRMKDLLEQLKAEFDLILIDSPPVVPLSDMNIFKDLVDGIILVVRSEKTPRAALLKAIDSLATDKLVGIVLNDMKQQPLARYYNGYGYYYTKKS